MNKLYLLFMKDGLQYHISGSRSSGVQSFFVNEESPANFISTKLSEILNAKKF